MNKCTDKRSEKKRAVIVTFQFKDLSCFPIRSYK